MVKATFNSLRNLLRRLSGAQVTEEDIHTLIDEGEQDGVIDQDEHRMIEAVLDLDETRVREILVPRTEMVALERNTPVDEAIRTVIDAGHSRIPIYDGDIDHIVGILYAKDLLKTLGRPSGEIHMDTLVRSAYIVPESKTISDLLREFKARHVHMAVAVDEYGGTSGLVTIEDILEEIVGDIRDEHDAQEPEAVVRVGEGEYLFDARSHIEDVEKSLGVSLPRGDYDTIGGFVSNMSGHVPARGERCDFDNLDITVEEADARRVSRIRIRLRPEEAGE